MLSDKMNNIHLPLIALLWAAAMLDKNTSLWCSTWSVKKWPERTSALSGSSRCASSPNPDDIFPGPVIPTGHIMTFNNTVRGAHKSTDKKPRGYLSSGVFFLCCVSSRMHIVQRIDTFPMRGWRNEAVPCVMSALDLIFVESATLNH